MTVFYTLIGIICGILNAILFWKIWNMCDNVAKITKKLCENSENTNIAKTICESNTAIESNEQSIEQTSEQTSETNESHNIAAGIIIAFILCSFIFLMAIMGGH